MYIQIFNGKANSFYLSLARLPSPALAVYSPRESICRRSHIRRLGRNIVAIHEELRKHCKVQNKCARTANKPAQVDQNVLAVNVRSLARLAMAALMPVAMRVLAANRLESENAEHESQISETSEEEEQSVEAFSRLAASVQ